MEHARKVVVAFIGVFIAGSVFGGFFAMRIGQAVTERRAEPVYDMRLLNQYATQLELTEDQRTRIRPIVEKAEQELTVVRQQERDSSLAILQRRQREIAAILTTEQQATLRDVELRQRGRGRGGPGNFEGGRGGGGNGGRGGVRRGGGQPPVDQQPTPPPPAAQDAQPTPAPVN
jgi:uncharacterized membrane protein YgcG